MFWDGVRKLGPVKFMLVWLSDRGIWEPLVGPLYEASSAAQTRRSLKSMLVDDLALSTVEA